MKLIEIPNELFLGVPFEWSKQEIEHFFETLEVVGYVKSQEGLEIVFDTVNIKATADSHTGDHRIYWNAGWYICLPDINFLVVNYKGFCVEFQDVMAEIVPEVYERYLKLKSKCIKDK